jgi:hypothetical protein
MNKTWYYLTRKDYEQYIKPLPFNSALKYKLLSQYKNKIPMLEVAYNQLKQKYTIK